MNARRIYLLILFTIFLIAFLPVIITCYGFLENREGYGNYNLLFLIASGLIASVALIWIALAMKDSSRP